MQFPKAEFGSDLPIDAIGAGFFRVEGRLWRGPILIYAEAVCDWAGMTDAAAIAGLAGKVDLALIGTGATLAPVPQAVRLALSEVGLMYDAMATASAARHYNYLLAEGRRVAAALLPLPAAGATA